MTILRMSMQILFVILFASLVVARGQHYPSLVSTQFDSLRSSFDDKYHSTPLEAMMNPDGTLKASTGFQGSIDPTGRRMLTDIKGRPHFRLDRGSYQDLLSRSMREKLPNGIGGPSRKSIASVPGDISWDDQFACAGLVGQVNSLAAGSNGDLFAGGWFIPPGKAYPTGIAKWDGSHWSALGSGANGAVAAIAVSGNDVYVGGVFDTAGGISVNHIAKWDGSHWSALGNGLRDFVWAIALNGSDVYAGGRFGSVAGGGLITPGIARWDGSSWYALGSGLDGEVFSVAVGSNGDIYAGGLFLTAGGVSANGIAKWDGTSWSALGNGVNGWVNCIAPISAPGGGAYVGGLFDTAGTVNAWEVAKWDGSNWSGLGEGVNNEVYALAIDSNGDVYAGGTFDSAGFVGASNIAKWDGSSWFALANGVNNQVNAIAAGGNDTYVGGWFSEPGGSGRNGIAKWNGSAWSGLYNVGPFHGLDEWVIAVALNPNGDVYVGGYFDLAGSVAAKSIAKWDGSSWSALGSGVNGQVTTIALNASEDIYAGGGFTEAGGVAAKHIAKWDGSTWSALGCGLDSMCRAIAVAPNGDLYAGGKFDSAGGVSAHHIAKWNGSTWSSLGSGLNDLPLSIAVKSNGDVYAAGLFTNAGGVIANHIAKWDGSTWSALGSGTDGTFVEALMLDSNGVLYAGGDFTTAGGVSANGIAKWNGSSWSALGSGVNGAVFAGEISPTGDLYVGGSFDHAGIISANNVAKWDGSTWASLGSGVEGWVCGMGFKGMHLYVGGLLGLAGGKPSLYFAHWIPPSMLSVKDKWNIVSLPLKVSDHSKAVLYPTAVSDAFGYAGSYIVEDTVENGAGYWLKFNGPQNIVVTGEPLTLDTISVVAGWNLIGSISTAIAENTIASIPPGLVASNLYGYYDRYYVSDTIKPGAGYWIKVTQSGKLIMSTTCSIALSTSRIRIVPSLEMPPSAPSDANPNSPIVPSEYSLEQNYPNPFNPATVISYQLPADSYVTLIVFDVLGREVARLVDGTQKAGYKSIRLDANSIGGGLASGIYLCRLSTTHGFTDVKKLVFTK